MNIYFLFERVLARVCLPVPSKFSTELLEPFDVEAMEESRISSGSSASDSDEVEAFDFFMFFLFELPLGLPFIPRFFLLDLIFFDDDDRLSSSNSSSSFFRIFLN